MKLCFMHKNSGRLTHSEKVDDNATIAVPYDQIIPSECGKYVTTQDKVVGGHEVNIETNPWQVSHLK